MQHLMIVRILHLLTGLSSHLEADETALGKTLKAPLAAICEWATKNGDVQP
jgi:DNA-binding HxlR family transcriptional regulator